MRQKYKVQDEYEVEEDFIKHVSVTFSDHLQKNQNVFVAEWPNGEGYNIELDDKQHISVTDGQFDAIKKAIKALEAMERPNA